MTILLTVVNIVFQSIYIVIKQVKVTKLKLDYLVTQSDTSTDKMACTELTEMNRVCHNKIFLKLLLKFALPKVQIQIVSTDT